MKQPFLHGPQQSYQLVLVRILFQGWWTMRTSIPRVVVLVSLFLLFNSSFFAAQQHASPPTVRADESTARLSLKEKGSVFSIELSASSSQLISATLKARIVAANA